jgi:hypothetical protein
MEWQVFLTISHLIGTVLGVGGATFAEIFYLKAAKDGQINIHESSTLKTIYYVLRIGMIILILSGFGYLIFYRLTGQTHLLYNPTLWAKLTIILVLLFGVVAWQAKKIPMWLGSAVSLTSWYAALVLGAWRGLEASYLTIIIAYFFAIVLAVVALAFIRKLLGIEI